MNWQLIKLAAWPLLLKCLRMLLTNIGTAVTTWLVAKHLVEKGSELTYINLAADCAPALAGMLPGALWQLWLWLNTFKWVTNIEGALHLPITGRKLSSTVSVAADAKQSEIILSNVIAPEAAMNLVMPQTPPANPQS